MTSDDQTSQQTDRPLISVIMAAYNAERFVGEAIESVQSQTYDNWELICVDDCSTDRTAEIVQAYADADKRITLIRKSENLGAAKARNIAIDHAAGEYLAILDADDVCMPDRFERSLSALFSDSDEIGFVHSDALFIDADARELGIIGVGERPREPLTELRAGRYHIVHSSVMMPRSVIDSVGYYREDFKYAQDFDLFLRIAERYSLVWISPPVVKYRTDLSQVTQSQSIRQSCYWYTALRLAEARRLGEKEPPVQELFDEEYARAIERGLPSEARLNAIGHMRMAHRYLQADYANLARRNYCRAWLADRSYFKALGALVLSCWPWAARTILGARATNYWVTVPGRENPRGVHRR